MKKYKFYTLLSFCAVSVFILSASTNYYPLKDRQADSKFLTDTVKQLAWLAPESADSLKNPVAVSQESISKGEELYNMYCFSCHGDTGYGDGPAGGSMGVRPANFHDQKVMKQKDGALFWKLTNGKGNMPPFKEALTEEQRWQLIVFLRELGKTE
ncbi:MAG: cytochrome c [Daejeonella sp.]|uniref:c-type cytochrome n=1 Tax=Daejeonella sp. TaxID=2805397 RepID=UPI002735CBB6|nr:cytochrome c [Daejeonella sp.]MDP3468085.1 cytochrome c [Daejeonella sp.]